MCPVSLYELYISKLNPKSDKLWQKPRQGEVFYIDSEWYEARPVGHDLLDRFMKHLSKSANLSTDVYTNHSIRATCIGTLDKRGFEARHITAISSHKNESTICQYSTKCQENKKREMFQALAETVIPKRAKKVTSTVSKSIEANKATGKASSPKDTTINVNQLKEITNVTPDQNTEQNALPPNFELVPFETDDDDMLLKYLDTTDFNTVTTNANQQNQTPPKPTK